ncbi:hypothetical protein RVR_9731 [Actinacidiphila reveromycinica]|uniref:AAA+ ATPase domain-containing protein n=1 Tax=Actinacidiphila reveromycinica TaxID=659352 RepID=A0A7U3V0L6_9ACTN|nr:ATP-binding protein [Streptomyces sp. SN-593]BBB02034.1 hypothetical protein RVR_9731 [Streptomyces sp. SN-593]
MPDADDTTSSPTGAGSVHRIDIGGSVTGSVVAGDHNVVVDARHGSQVTVVAAAERPRPERRERAEVLPRALPAPVGREEAEQALAAAVRGGGPVQVWGSPGVGKTTLLRHAARSLPPGADGTVFLSGARRDVEDLAQDIFEACYEAPGYAPGRAELTRLMAGVRVTVYVDDAEMSSDQLLELLDTAPDATFVLATAERTLWSGGTALELTGLSQDAGRRLLERELGGALADTERDAAAALWQAAAGRPLPLLRAAALARSDGSDSRREGGPRLPRVAEVTCLLPALLDQLASDQPVMGVLHLLATFDEAEVAAAHVGALAEVSDPAAVCDHLVRLGLARLGEHGYASVADTVPVVRGRFTAPFPAERLCVHFAQWAALPGTTPSELAAHAPVFERVAEAAEAAGRPDLAVRLAQAAAPGLARSLRFAAWGRMLGRGWFAARAAGDRPAQAYFLHEQAVRALLIGRRVAYAALLGEAVSLGHKLAAGAAHASAGGTAQAGAGQPPFDLHQYMAQHTAGSAHSGASAGHGALAQPPGGAGNAGSWGGASGHGGSGASAASGHGTAGPATASGHGAGSTATTSSHAPAGSATASGHGTAGASAAPGHGAGGTSALSGHGATAGSAAHTSAAGGGSWGGGTGATSHLAASSGAATASSGAATAAGAAATGVSTLVMTVVSLIAAAALVGGIGYAVSSSDSHDSHSQSADAHGAAQPTPPFTFSLPPELTDTSTPTDDPLTSPPGCEEENDAHEKADSAMATAPTTNPGADEAWAASEQQLSLDLAAAADTATDPQIKAAIQKESDDEASLSTAITDDDQAAMSQYIDAVYNDDAAVINLC